MYRELNLATRRSVSETDFTNAYRDAAEVATLRALEPDVPEDTKEVEGETVVPVAITADTVAFGQVTAELELPFAEGGIAWDPSLVFPGLEAGEHL
jgi:hypothetical protein